MMDLTWLPPRILVGLSGGADSVALLLMLLETPREISAVHVHHGLRGPEADADEAFVQALCKRLGVPLYCYRAIPPEHPSEAWAREARYGFFRQAQQKTGVDALALAHHMDDQAETVLIHLLRGAGLQGLSGMRRDSVYNGLRIVRPLLSVSRHELQAYLTERHQPWREDGSNAERTYLRNVLRLDALPLLEQASPGAARRMAQAAQLLQGDLDALDTLAMQHLRQAGSKACLPLQPLTHQPLGLQRRILRLWWAQQLPDGPVLSAAQTEELTALLHAVPGKRCNLPHNWHGYRGWTHVHLLSPYRPHSSAAVPFHPEHGAALEGVHLNVTAFDGWPGDGVHAQAFPLSMLTEELTLRCRQRGDWMRPFGAPGSRSLQDVLVDRHIDEPFRDHLPLLCRGHEVLLAAGVGAGHVPACTEDQPFALLRWTGDMPWLRTDAQH